MTSTSSVEFNGQVVVISGAATGIGKASAQLIAARGATVIALDFNAAALADLAKNFHLPLTKATSAIFLARIR